VFLEKKMSLRLTSCGAEKGLASSETELAGHKVKQHYTRVYLEEGVFLYTNLSPEFSAPLAARSSKRRRRACAFCFLLLIYALDYANAKTPVDEGRKKIDFIYKCELGGLEGCSAPIQIWTRGPHLLGQSTKSWHCISRLHKWKFNFQDFIQLQFNQFFVFK